MIGKEEFLNLIKEHKEQEQRVDDLCRIFSEVFQNPIIDWGFRIFDNLLKAYFDKEGVEWIQYYLYENPKHCYCQKGKKYPLNTLDDLWTIVENYRK